jgi:hypothetical protein
MDMWDSCVERSLDFVRAAVAQRRELGGLQKLDETMDLNPHPAPLTHCNLPDDLTYMTYPMT